MKQLQYLFLLFTFSIFAQDSIQVQQQSKIKFKADSIIDVDNFGTIFYTLNNSLIKKQEEKLLKYSNVQLGSMTSSSTFNPLKINIFYKTFNTVIILDNRLAEIFKVDFNQVNPYKNVSHISTGSDNTLWIFNQDLMQLELYDYKTNTIRAKTLPIENNVLDITSNYNSCWLLTKNYIYKYNYFGSLVSKMPNTGYTSIKESNENIFFKKDKNIFYLEENTKNIKPINIPNFLISQFFVTNQNLYIYTDKELYQYKLKLK
ncbi:hypothetical protein CLV86_0777 [Lacinutrix venerupis]|uniref:hypothetical protein n=1 Tax=Lacinutrix venerupis TaxID=1486034 RepID=UPI000EB1B230|nr:hypothetical protein [Lacinutrix venerupis]RLJ67283.1 hypothetical protein CLV86_0777 [Lacinutrix venerupis]